MKVLVSFPAVSRNLYDLQTPQMIHWNSIKLVGEEARIVHEAGIFRLPCRADKMEKDFNWCVLCWFESMKYSLWFSLELR